MGFRSGQDSWVSDPILERGCICADLSKLSKRVLYNMGRRSGGRGRKGGCGCRLAFGNGGQSDSGDFVVLGIASPLVPKGW